MKTAVYLAASLLLACGSPKKSNSPVVVIPDRADSIPPPPPPKPVPPPKPTGPPEGAVTAVFAPDGPATYAYVKKVHRNKGGMTIAFQDNRLPAIEIREGTAALLSTVQLLEFSSPVLMVNAQLNDPDFHKYSLYVWKGDHWHQPVNPWAVHLDHNPTDLPTIRQERKGFIKRYYSVFDLDTEGETTYTWRLLEEEVPVRVE